MCRSKGVQNEIDGEKKRRKCRTKRRRKKKVRERRIENRKRAQEENLKGGKELKGESKLDINE